MKWHCLLFMQCPLTANWETIWSIVPKYELSNVTRNCLNSQRIIIKEIFFVHKNREWSTPRLTSSIWRLPTCWGRAFILATSSTTQPRRTLRWRTCSRRITTSWRAEWRQMMLSMINISGRNEWNEVPSGIPGCSCGTVGTAVVPDTRDPQFESSHWKCLSPVWIEKNKMKQKGTEIVRFLKNIPIVSVGEGI